MGLGIDVGVGGRFHSDRLVQALLAQGHDAHLWTSYPTNRFPLLPTERVHSLLWPELVYRAAKRLGQENRGDLFKMTRFGGALASQLKRSTAEVFVGWSSFSLETLKIRAYRHQSVIRDSIHILKQMELLNEEYARFGVAPVDRSLACERELKEYEAADSILVLSDYAKRTFIEAGIAEAKIRFLKLGVDTRLFRPISRDCVRLPLKVVYFGSVSVRKGMPYLFDAIQHFSPSQVQWTIIGPVEGVLQQYRRKLPQVKWISPRSQSELAELLPEQDIFVLPTIEDGFGQTLIQAMACGLVPIATDRCGAAEILQNGVNGFQIPAQNTAAIVDTISELVSAPERILEMRAEILASTPYLSWSRYDLSVADWVQSIELGGR